MKTLLLLLSIIFILTSGCGDSTENSEEGAAPSEPRNERTDDDSGSEGDATDTPPVAQTPAPKVEKNACAEYSATCRNDKECGEKYARCLRPKAGKPATTEEIVCTRTQGTKEEKITLTLNEWGAAAGDNNLLCDFLELEDNTEYLIQFATVVKDTCKNQRNARKQDLIKVGFNCAPPEEPQQQRQPQQGQPQGGEQPPIDQPQPMQPKPETEGE